MASPLFAEVWVRATLIWCGDCKSDGRERVGRSTDEGDRTLFGSDE